PLAADDASLHLFVREAHDRDDVVDHLAGRKPLQRLGRQAPHRAGRLFARLLLDATHDERRLLAGLRFDLLHQFLARLRRGEPGDPLEGLAVALERRLRLALAFRDRRLAFLEPALEGVLFALLLAEQLQAALEIALLLAQAVFLALQVLALLPRLLFVLGLGGGATLLDLEVDFLGAQARPILRLALEGGGAGAALFEGAGGRAPPQRGEDKRRAG